MAGSRYRFVSSSKQLILSDHHYVRSDEGQEYRRNRHNLLRTKEAINCSGKATILEDNESGTASTTDAPHAEASQMPNYNEEPSQSNTY